MYGGYYGYGYYWDPTYFLVLVGLVLCLGASALVNSTMRKYSKVRNMRGLTGAEGQTLFFTVVHPQRTFLTGASPESARQISVPM